MKVERKVLSTIEFASAKVDMGYKNEKKESYQVVVEGGQGELVEKKSRFIATVQPCLLYTSPSPRDRG